MKIRKDAKIIYVNTEKLKRLAKTFGFKFDKKELLKNYENGDFLFMRQKENGKQIVYVLWEIYIQKFDMNYSCNSSIKKGKELFISNFKLPSYNKLKKRKEI